MSFRVVVMPRAVEMIEAIPDRRVQLTIVEIIEGLANDPEKQGKPLVGELGGYRSLRAAGQRYRILYRVERQVVQVLVVAVGIRKEGHREDVYALAKKLLRLRLL